MDDQSFNERMKKKLLRRDSGWLPGSPSMQSNFGQAQRNGSISVVGMYAGDGPTRLDSAQLSERTLGADDRGMVISELSPANFPSASGFVFDGATFDENAIRAALIFYDRFDIPSTNAIGYTSPTQQALQTFDIVQSSRMNYNGDLVPGMKRAAFDAFSALDAREPGKWTMGRSAQAFGVPADELAEGHGFAITLANALPIFHRSVPLEEVIRFKYDRFDELIRLRKHFDDLGKKIAENGSADIANSKEFRDFDAALSDHFRLMEETRFQTVLTSASRSLSWDLIGPPLIESALTHTIDANGLIGAAAMFGIKTVQGLRTKKNLNPFEYLTSVSRGLG